MWNILKRCITIPHSSQDDYRSVYRQCRGHAVSECAPLCSTDTSDFESWMSTFCQMDVLLSPTLHIGVSGIKMVLMMTLFKCGPLFLWAVYEAQLSWSCIVRITILSLYIRSNEVYGKLRNCPFVRNLPKLAKQCDNWFYYPHTFNLYIGQKACSDLHSVQ